MKTYKNMYVSCYTDRTFYINKFEVGADAYVEDLQNNNIEKLRVLCVLSSNINNELEEMDIYDCEYDYDVIFTMGCIKYAIAFEIDCEIDELPDIENYIYC